MPESLTHSGADALHDALPTFLQHCNREKYRARSTLIEAGEHANKLFYLLKGSVSVSTERDGREFVLAYLREGDFSAGVYSSDTVAREGPECQTETAFRGFNGELRVANTHLVRGGLALRI